ncbi:MAG: ATP-binding cassette domain-containing protein [Tepidisphaeraceae bacterium]
MLVELNGVTFGYGTRRVVRVERLALDRGRCVGVYGPNGAGKTTLVRGILGLLQPIEGSVTRFAGLRPGYMPQSRALQLHWPMSGMDVAAMAISAQRPLGFIGTARDRLREAMRELDVDDLAKRPYATLSGGQQQRLLLAGLIATEPNLFVLDEPTDGLDARTRDKLLLHLRNLLTFTRTGTKIGTGAIFYPMETAKFPTKTGEQIGTGAIFPPPAMVVISHDVDELVYLADEVAWIHPADDPDAPSRVELISPRELAGRMAGLRVGA